jgi:pimeloyl-ACP methyl ester carboxylesterase
MVIRDEAPVSLAPLSQSIGAGETHHVANAPDGTRLFVRCREGAHPAGATRAYLCDGIMCDGFIWKYLWDALAPLMPLTHWHYRGHGRSAPPHDSNRVDIAAHADDLMAVRAMTGDPPCVLFGHSMGTQVSLEAYRRHPHHVRGMVLLCGTFGQPTKTFHGNDLLDQMLPKIARAVKKNEAVARALWSRIPEGMAINIAMRVGELDPSLSVEDVKPYLQHMKGLDFPMIVKMLTAAGEHSAEDILSEIKVPVLIVAGERDTFTPAFLAEKMAKVIPNAELLVVKNGTHAVPIEQHEIIDDTVRRFLRERVLH